MILKDLKPCGIVDERLVCSVFGFRNRYNRSKTSLKATSRQRRSGFLYKPSLLFFAYAICLLCFQGSHLWAADTSEKTGSKATTSAATKPNVLFVAVDDLNDWTGTLGGYKGAQTPNLDRLSSRGILFANAQCSAPACNPSRASLLCGIRPSTSGVYFNIQPWREAMPDVVTLPQHFMAHGYHVVGGGKIFHGKYKDPASWHEYFKTKWCPAPANRPANGIPNSRSFDWGPVDVLDKDMGDMKAAQWAVNYLQKKHEKPFFLAVGLIRPHLPWYVPRKYFDRYRLDKIVPPTIKLDDLDDVPPIGRRIAMSFGDHERIAGSNNWESAVRGYLASVTFADACVGLLLDALDDSEYADNTIVVLWGDHGWHLGEKLHWRKMTLWEESARVPLIIVAPGVTKSGERCARVVSLLDLYPTLIELCGLKPKSELEGVSLVSLLANPKAPRERPAITTYGQNNHTVRSERWRYIQYSDGTEELYDHQNDPMEWVNLADKPEYAQTKKQLAAWLPKVNAPNNPPVDFDPAKVTRTHSW